MKAYGKKTWLIPDTFLDSVSKNAGISHEAICVINTSDVDAKIQFTLFFEDREARTDFSSQCPAMRTHHIRMDKLRPVSKLERILFPIVVTVVTGLILPMSVPLVGILMFGNLLRECGCDAGRIPDGEAYGRMLDAGLNCPVSSGMGRLFDGVVSILNRTIRRENGRIIL